MFEFARSKNFLILVLFLVATIVSIWLVSLPTTPHIRNIMADNPHQLTNQKNINTMTMNDGKDLHVDETLLELLGFSGQPRLYPNIGATHAGMNLPVIVTAVTKTSSDYNKAIHLLHSVAKHLPDRHVLVYDLGLSSGELVKLKKLCNETTNCMVKSFDFEKFPNHLRMDGIRAYRPVIIQEALNEYGAVFWTSSSEYFTTGSINTVLKKAETSGIAAWRIESEEPTSAHTHPKMFSYFQTDPTSYYFHHMVSTDHVILYNTKAIHKELMLRWVACALTLECIWPTGAQNVGCNSQRRPLYRYSGCHRFEVSALNILLGIIFESNEQSYTVKEKIFGVDNITENTTPKIIR